MFRLNEEFKNFIIPILIFTVQKIKFYTLNIQGKEQNYVFAFKKISIDNYDLERRTRVLSAHN